MENSETQVWLEFALECKYIEQSQKIKLEKDTLEVGKLLNHMMQNPEKYLSNNVIKR